MGSSNTSSTTSRTRSLTVPWIKFKDKPPPQRPSFDSRITSDRLRESTLPKNTPFAMQSKLKKGRKSVFIEVGLIDHVESRGAESTSHLLNSLKEDDSEETAVERYKAKQNRSSELPPHSTTPTPTDTRATTMTDSKPRRQNTLPSKLRTHLTAPRARPRIRSASTTVSPGSSLATQVILLVFFIAIIIPAVTTSGFIPGAKAGPVYEKRENSPTKVCRRWAQQTALLNGTVYMYGGRSTAEQGQSANTWNNDFITLDLTKDWETKSLPLKGLPIPNGPPPVALGYLWNDYNNLFLYGGEFSDTPFVSPGPESIWQYSIDDGSWTERKDPQTLAGNYSEPALQPVHRAAEGAGLSVPELGLSWYFGGHLDWSTVPGWSNQVDRVYLKSLLEFTHPGYINSGVDNLRTSGAGASGAFRNISQGGVQQANEFPERADGVLVYVPGWGPLGCLIGMAGGTEQAFAQDLGTLDVYDIASSTWFHQKTTGDTPSVRVDLCAVVASAADASSFQIYLFGGQNLQPYGNQTQYNDMYILTIPSFTWIKVNSTDSTPSPRAGHTCTMQDGQIILIGGYSGENATCDSPGAYIFDASTLEWKDSFSAGDHPADYHPDNSVLAGSYGYQVPGAVQKVVGGDSKGGASASTPAAGPASSGPFATGKPPVFTVTQSGATQTITSPAGARSSSSSSLPSSSSSSSSHSNNTEAKSHGLIAAGVIAGSAAILSLYLGFCAILYRRQIRAYRHHLSVSNNYYYPPGSTNDLPTMDQIENPDAAFLPRGTSHFSNSDSMSYAGAAGVGATGKRKVGGWEDYGNGNADDYDDRTPWLAGSNGLSSSSGTRKTGVETSGSGSISSNEGFEGGEPSFFQVVMGPRRALRVVNAGE